VSAVEGSIGERCRGQRLNVGRGLNVDLDLVPARIAPEPIRVSSAGSDAEAASGLGPGLGRNVLTSVQAGRGGEHPAVRDRLPR
jgi:hypothetical protein